MRNIRNKVCNLRLLWFLHQGQHIRNHSFELFRLFLHNVFQILWSLCLCFLVCFMLLFYFIQLSSQGFRYHLLIKKFLLKFLKFLILFRVFHLHILFHLLFKIDKHLSYPRNIKTFFDRLRHHSGDI